MFTDTFEHIEQRVMKSILIFVALNVKILRNCPFNKFAKEDVAAVICVDYVEL